MPPTGGGERVSIKWSVGKTDHCGAV